jgi:hypothetical protein
MIKILRGGKAKLAELVKLASGGEHALMRCGEGEGAADQVPATGTLAGTDWRRNCGRSTERIRQGGKRDR